MSDSHANWLRRAADEIAKAGHYGWGNTCADAAEHIAALEAELAALRIENDALRAELQKVRSAAISGMDAATQHGRGLVQQAAKLRAESNPDVLESERAANALLTEQLEKAEAERDKNKGCCVELREIAESINDPRLHNTITIAQWCREIQAEREAER